jgi:hypothetical protein
VEVTKAAVSSYVNGTTAVEYPFATLLHNHDLQRAATGLGSWYLELPKVTEVAVAWRGIQWHGVTRQA